MIDIDFRQMFVQNFNREFNDKICRCINMGFAAYHRLKLETDFFAGYDKGTSIHSHLLKFAIEKEIAKTAFTPTSKHRAMPIKLNEYGYNGLFLCTDDFVVTIAKTNRKMALPRSSSYKKRLSKANSDLATQLRLNMDGLIVDDAFRYAIITYGRNKYFELSHLNIIAPEPDYNGIIPDLSIDIMKNNSFVVYPNMVTEEQLTTLKNEFQKNQEKG